MKTTPKSYKFYSSSFLSCFIVMIGLMVCKPVFVDKLAILWTWLMASMTILFWVFLYCLLREVQKNGRVVKKEDYEKYISSNGKQLIYNHLLVVTPKFKKLMEKHGRFCARCHIPFIPQPYYGKNFPSAPHYPTKKICGFCIYDMNAYESSRIYAEEEDPLEQL